jgi:purine-binding chemotaxis protein CheW
VTSRETTPDWAQIRAQLEVCTRALQAALEQLPASPAAAPGEPDASTREPELSLVAFGVGVERYALEKRYVRKILPSATVTPIPGIAGALAGVAAVDGIVLPVFDLAAMLGLASREELAYDRIVAIGHEGCELGLLSSTEESEASLPPGELVAVPWQLVADNEALVRGLTPEGTIVLDGQALLADQRFFFGARHGHAEP